MTNDADDPNVLRSVRRIEIDSAIGLGLSLLCCVLGLLLSMWNLRKLNQLSDAAQGQWPPGIQVRLSAARALAIGGIVLAIAIPLTALLWWAITLFLNNA